MADDWIFYLLGNDLRRRDNPAWHMAARQARETGARLAILAIEDNDPHDPWAISGASLWWRWQALGALDQDSGPLSFFKGKAHSLLPELIKQFCPKTVIWTSAQTPSDRQTQDYLRHILNSWGCATETAPANLLWTPGTITKADGTPYRVFTPFYRRGCLESTKPTPPIGMPADIKPTRLPGGMAYRRARPSLQSWQSKLADHWQISEHGAWSALNNFLETGLHSYKDGRNLIGQPFVSKLSPYIHHGQISIHRIWHEAKKTKPADDPNLDHFLSELGWREFSHHLLHFWPRLPDKNYNNLFNHYPWRKDKSALHKWQTGETGIPIIDAAMKELWTTGYMHNRARMIVASFLTKNLRIHWREGARWFWKCLVDADLANNSASWQWVAGSGADAAPYFRIFNPITQSRKFDPNGQYIKTHLPMLNGLDFNQVHSPWTYSPKELIKAGLELGNDYPRPMVNLKLSREAALDAYYRLKTAAAEPSIPPL